MALKKSCTFEEYRAHVGQKYFDQFTQERRPVDLFADAGGERYWTPPKAMRYWAFIAEDHNGELQDYLNINDEGVIYVRHLRMRDRHVDKYWRFLNDFLPGRPNVHLWRERYSYLAEARAEEKRRREAWREANEKREQRQSPSLRQLTR